MEQDTKKQTAAEARKAECARIQAELEQQGYVREDATISILKANLMMLVTSLPICILLGLLYGLVNVIRRETAFSDFRGIVFWLAMLISIPVHEFLHGLGWVSSCKNGWKSIRFGVMWSSLTPYCNCKEPMDVKSYYRGLLMPFAVLGLLPSLIAIAVGNVMLLAIGLVNILLAGGDLTIALVIRKYTGKQAMLLDHPSECGCLAFLKGEDAGAAESGKEE
ncbi:MAG: DUF3267 domain-containing protein [Oscillospiraceae bacterium]|nr:DUF3267 domain-containing protein [Oscillospiraceae bacterium]